MPRKEGQKLKLLALLEILARETDEAHPLSVPRLVEMLRERGINAERKSVYDDIETLNSIPDAGFEIVQQRGRGGGYYDRFLAQYKGRSLLVCPAALTLAGIPAECWDARFAPEQWLTGGV